ERFHLFECDVLVVANTTLRRPGIPVVLDTVSREDLHASIVHLNGEVDGELSLAMTQHLPHPIVEAHDVRCGMELLHRNIPQGPRLMRRIHHLRRRVYARDHLEQSRLSIHKRSICRAGPPAQRVSFSYSPSIMASNDA